MLLQWIKVKTVQFMVREDNTARLCLTCKVYEMLCCIKPLKMRSKDAAANHSHISQVVPTLRNGSFVWVSNHSANQSA